MSAEGEHQTEADAPYESPATRTISPIIHSRVMMRLDMVFDSFYRVRTARGAL